MSQEQKPLGPISITVHKDELRNMIIKNVLDILKSVKLSMLQTQKFEPRDVVDVLKSLPEKDLRVQLEEEIKSTVRTAEKISEEVAATVKKFTEDLRELMKDILNDDNSKFLASEMLKKYTDIMKRKREFSKHPPFLQECLDDKFKMEANDSTGTITVTARGKISSAMHKAITDDTQATEYLALVSDMLSNLRKKQQRPQAEEYVAIQFAYHLLARGHIMPHCYQWLGLPGTRKYTQTYLFITDPGPGNIKVTCKDPELMKGVVVHTEHIDRGEIKDKSLVEAYRIPAHINAAKVRLHVGADAPCCAFIGRPVFEGVGHEYEFVDDASDLDLFKINLLKSAHMTASACTAMFINGIAECKIAIEKMSKNQAIEFMRSVRANTIRNSQWQFFSAAFNLFTPIKVGSHTETDKFKIAHLAIEITKEGGFEKVTWDGAEDGKVPSDPITDTLGHEGLVQLVHEAHENGLICYVSAGIEDKHVPDAVVTGVDGIGIGTWLHYRGEEGMGELKPENIKAVLKSRDMAAKTPCGRAAAILARLDYQFYEKSIDESRNILRMELLDALKKKDEVKINDLLEQYQRGNGDQYPQHDHPMYNHGIALHRAYNLLATKKPIAAKSFSEDVWKSIREMMSASSDCLNHTALENILLNIVDRQLSKKGLN